MADKEILRFAPSPTGQLHVGAARTALFNWVWAKHSGGEFHLRIEDTDQARQVKGAEDQIKEGLTWLGLNWDGPIVHQSKRAKDGVYREVADQLVKDGWAAASKEEAGEVIRFKWPDQPKRMTVAYFDLPKDPWTVTFDPAKVPFEDFVLIKSDGFPTYNFAHVIDDHELGVTRVIRGDEFTSSLNKYVALHEALGWKPPRYNHVPTILGADKKKLSKREGAADVLDYRRDGYVPEALANFIALIGWAPGKDRELFFSFDELAEAFTLEGVQRSPGIFDRQKLDWMNREHLKNLDVGALLALAEAAGVWKPRDAVYDGKVLGLAVERATTLKDLGEVRQSYFYRRPKLTKGQLVGDENPETVGVWLERVHRELKGLPAKDWQAPRLKSSLTTVLDELDLVPKQLYPVLREAVTGAPQTPALWDILDVLGKDESMARFEQAAALVA